jgi:hypothetical protein
METLQDGTNGDEQGATANVAALKGVVNGAPSHNPADDR